MDAVKYSKLNAARLGPDPNRDSPRGFALAPEGVPMGAEKLEWLVSFVQFLYSSGGFEQW